MSYKKTKIIFFMCIAIFIAVLSLAVYEYLNLLSTEKNTTSLEQDIVQEKDSIQAFRNLVKDASNIKADSEKANTFFIKREEVASFLDMIESLSATTKTQISIQSVGDKKTTTNNALVSVVIQANGSYSNIYFLIRMLEELPYQTEIQSVKLSKQGDSANKKGNTDSWSANIEVVGVMY